MKPMRVKTCYDADDLGSMERERGINDDDDDDQHMALYCTFKRY